MSPPIHKGIRKLNEIKSCCKEKDSFKNFAPRASSSFVEDKVYSSLSDAGLEESTPGYNNTSISAITKKSCCASRPPREKPAQKVAACCRSDFKPTPDQTVTSVPASTKPEAFPSSKSLAKYIREKYNQSRPGTYTVTINNTYSRPEVSPYKVTHYLRTYVPRASRNYNTYEISERSQNSSSSYKTNLQPPYFSTPIAKSYEADVLFDRSWDNNFSSIQNTTPSSDSRAYNVRPDTFNVTKPSSLQRYARTIPTVDRLYANPNLTRKVHPVQQNYTYNYPKNSYTRTQSEAADRTFTKRLLEESAYAQLADSEMPDTNIERPQSFPTQTLKPRTRLRQQDQSPYSQLADTTHWSQSAQMPAPNISERFPLLDPPYERPRSAEASTGGKKLPASYRARNGRPITADSSFVPRYSDVHQPPFCRRGDEGTKIANSNFKPKRNLYYSANTCGKRIKPPNERGELWNQDTYSVIQQVSDNTQTNFGQTDVGCQCRDDSEGPLDTLLEIRTPHKVFGGASVQPFVLSINVSCADRSVVVSPDKADKSISPCHGHPV